WDNNVLMKTESELIFFTSQELLVTKALSRIVYEGKKILDSVWIAYMLYWNAEL
ncbi:hypothetical protein ACJX0J_029361, partial [Zea mays]